MVCVGPLRCVAFQETRARDLILKTFRNERPAIPEREVHGNAFAKNTTPGAAIIGVTLWRMRPSISSDPVKIRGLVHDPEQPDDTKEWTAERISTQASLAEGQFVRLSIESARRGYLYVIDRDVYADGTKGAPSLIFPTLRLRGGDNRVQPGIAIEIPDAQDRPPIFRVKKTRPDQVTVMLTVIVAFRPISEIRPSREAQKLNPELLATWENRWSTKTERLEYAASLGNAYTTAEQAAAQPNPRPLGPNDPLPATLIEAKTPPGQPMLISVSIRLE
jgi:hypothetical protein